MEKNQRLIVLILLLPGLVFAFLTGYYLRGYLDNTGDSLAIVKEARDLLLVHGYYEPPNGNELGYGMIQGMLNAYGDPFSTFNKPAQHELTNDLLKGEYGGIGVDLERTQDGSIVIFPYPGSTAENGGILDNDILLMVDDLNITTETTLDEVNAKLRGALSKDIWLHILRPENNKTLEFEISREVISIPSVTYHPSSMYPTHGIIKINVLSHTTPGEIETAIDNLLELGVQRFIIDLRNNHGGLLQSGIDSAMLFANKGIVLKQQYRDMAVEEIEAEKPGKYNDSQLSILVNNQTASAAEIFAGILQYQERAVVYGLNSFGKDSIQLVFELADTSSLHVTSARWWFPSYPEGIHMKGIKPDVIINIDDVPMDSIIEIIEDH